MTRFTRMRHAGARFFRTPKGMLILLLGVLLALVFGGQKDAIPFWCIGALQELGRRAGKLGGTGDLLAQMKKEI